MMKERNYTSEVTDKFLVMGGECNYMFKVKPEGETMYDLEEVAWDLFATDEMRSWSDDDINELMDLAESNLKSSCEKLRLNVTCLRKQRAVGCYPKEVGDRIAYEALEDVAMSVHDLLKGRAKVPFCAFNGNLDVWVDLGDKRYGIEALQVGFFCRCFATQISRPNPRSKITTQNPKPKTLDPKSLQHYLGIGEDACFLNPKPYTLAALPGYRGGCLLPHGGPVHAHG